MRRLFLLFVVWLSFNRDALPTHGQDFPLSPNKACDQAWWDLFPAGIYFDMVLDEARNRIYATDCLKNALDVVDMTTLKVVQHIPIGLEPLGIDMSPDGNAIAIGAWGDGKIQILDLNDLTLSASIQLLITQTVNGNTLVEQYLPYDLLYASDTRLISQAAETNGGSGRFVQVDLNNSSITTYKDIYLSQATRIAAPPERNTLYATMPNVSPQQLIRFDIKSDGITETARAPHGPVSASILAIDAVRNRIFTAEGQIWSSDLQTFNGTYQINTNSIGQVEYISATNRIFASTRFTDTAILVDGAFNLPLRTYTFDGQIGVARATANGQWVYVSTANGIRKLNIGFPNFNVLLPVTMKP